MARVINLNYYTLVEQRDDADVVVVPFKVNGISQPDICLKSKHKKDEVFNTTNVDWNIGVRISTAGTRVEYNDRVRWWFESSTDEYKKMINVRYGTVIPSVKDEISLMQLWLYKCQKSQRKSNLSNFIERWLNRTSKRIYSRGA